MGILLDADIYNAQNETVGQIYRSYSPSLDVAFKFVQDGRSQTVSVSVLSLAVFFSDRGCAGEAFTSESGWRNGIVRARTESRYFKFTPDLPITRHAISALDNNFGCRSIDFNVNSSFLLRETAVSFTEPLAWPLYIR